MTIGILYTGTIELVIENNGNNILRLSQIYDVVGSQDIIDIQLTIFDSTYTHRFFVGNHTKNIYYSYIVINPYTETMQYDLYMSNYKQISKGNTMNIIKPTEFFTNKTTWTEGNVNIPSDLSEWISVSDIILETTDSDSVIYKFFLYTIPKDTNKAEMMLYEMLPHDSDNCIVFDIYG